MFFYLNNGILFRDITNAAWVRARLCKLQKENSVYHGYCTQHILYVLSTISIHVLYLQSSENNKTVKIASDKGTHMTCNIMSCH
jgi:general stress protein CsbA